MCAQIFIVKSVRVAMRVIMTSSFMLIVVSRDFVQWHTEEWNVLCSPELRQRSKLAYQNSGCPFRLSCTDVTVCK